MFWVEQPEINKQAAKTEPDNNGQGIDCRALDELRNLLMACIAPLRSRSTSIIAHHAAIRLSDTFALHGGWMRSSGANNRRALENPTL
jgi:hypothetical protein